MTESIEKICPACGSGTSFKVGHHAAWCENCAFECAACFWDQLSKQRQELDVTKIETTALKKIRDGYQMQQSMLIGRLGGEVDGAPTSTINYLQRVDELRELEKENQQLKAKLAKYEAMFEPNEPKE